MKKLLFILALITAGMSACYKGELVNNSLVRTADTTVSTPIHKPDTVRHTIDTAGDYLLVVKGVITGTILPAAGVEEIKLSSQTAGKAMATLKPDLTGYFRFTNLVPGKYTVSIHTVPGYLQPADIPVILGADGDVSVGAIQLEPLIYGTVSGTIVPAQAVTAMRVVSLSGYNTVATMVTDPNSGVFQSHNLAVGSYQLLFTAAQGYIAPPARTFTIVSGQNTDLGAIQFTAIEITSSISCKVNGVPTNFLVSNGSKTTIVTTYESSRLSVNATIKEASATGTAAAKGRVRQLIWKLENVTGPGTYTCNETTAGAEMSYIDYRYISFNPVRPPTHSSKQGQSATIIITAINPGTRTITGSFFADLNAIAPSYSGPAAMQLTEGVFNIKY